MSIYAVVSEISATRLWGLNASQRLQRQISEINKASGDLEEIKWLENPNDVPADSSVLVINGTYLFEVRTLSGILARPNSLLVDTDESKNDFSNTPTETGQPQTGAFAEHPHGTVAAAFVQARYVQAAITCINNPEAERPKALKVINPENMAAFDESLRRSTTPLLEVVTAARKQALEDLLYGNSYRGITDLVTKFLWPRPAKQVVRLCANSGITPNMVTSAGLLLVIAACYLFLQQHYALGLLAGWIMTFLDTVDGKLARVTVKSSKFGHLFDHGIDLFHPPFWYIYWGMSLVSFKPVLGLEQSQMYWLIIIAYVLGRVVEGLFPLLGSCSVFTWRPYDAWFRLITARRNPCLIILTASVLLARPDWGFIAVTFWSVITTLMLIIRLLQATIVRQKNGPLTSWLSAEDVATGPNARAYALFGATRSAYARS
jgi:phosphatidylglycerophosphate synthase